MATSRSLTQILKRLAVCTAIGIMPLVVHTHVEAEGDRSIGARCQCSGPFLGASLPGMKPEVFCPKLFSVASGIVGSNLHSSVYFSPDGREVYFTLPFGSSESQSIVAMRSEGGVWSEPFAASFSSDYSDQMGWFSPDGKRLYFGSVRPAAGESDPSPDFRWWMVERLEDNWNQPQFLSSPSSLPYDDGPIYIYDESEDENQSINIFRTAWVSGQYSTPVDIGSPPNTSLEDYPVLVAPDESYLIIYRSDPANRHNSGLFISFSDSNGWSVPKRMGDQIGAGFDASLSPCGKFLFYLKRNDGIYWVDTDILDYLRSHDLNLVDKLLSTANQNAEAVPHMFDVLRQTHSAHYCFDERCLREVVTRLAYDGSLEAAATVEQLSASLYPEARTAADALLTYAVRQHSDSLEMLCSELLEAGPDDRNAYEWEMNRLGYILLRADLLDDALRVFKLNVELFPKSYNTYDSYAEGLSYAGRTEEAITNYEKSLELNPGNHNARKMLDKLTGSKEGR